MGCSACVSRAFVCVRVVYGTCVWCIVRLCRGLLRLRGGVVRVCRTWRMRVDAWRVHVACNARAEWHVCRVQCVRGAWCVRVGALEN